MNWLKAAPYIAIAVFAAWLAWYVGHLRRENADLTTQNKTLSKTVNDYGEYITDAAEWEDAKQKGVADGMDQINKDGNPDGLIPSVLRNAIDRLPNLRPD